MLNRINRAIAAAFAAACLLIAVLPAVALADEGAQLQPGGLVTQAGAYPSGTSGTCSWTLLDDGHLVIGPTDGVEGTLATSTLPQMYKPFITKVSFNGAVHAAVRFRMLEGCTALESVDFTGFDMSGITNMSGMFSGCSSLESVNLSGQDTSGVSSMEGMFANCTALKTVNLAGLDFSKVTTMGEMFYNCPSLVSVIVTEWGTPSLGSTISMFYGCSSLKAVNLAGLDTSNVAYMNRMFAGCASLESLNLSGFDTSHVTSMISMFEGCGKLEALDVSSFNVVGVSSMKSMFAGCSALESLDLSTFSTLMLTSTESMFAGCSMLESLDLSNLNMSLVKPADSESMFEGCTSLARVTLGKNVANLSGFPAGSTGYWTSADEGAVFSVDEILAQRQGIADTYTEVPAANSLANAEIVVTPASLTYTGEELRPSVAISISGNVLTADVDYTLTYKNNVDIGTATVIARGKGAYVGKGEATFSIVAAPPADEDPETPENPDDSGSGSGSGGDEPGKADEGDSSDKPAGGSEEPSGSGAHVDPGSDAPSPGQNTPSDDDKASSANDPDDKGSSGQTADNVAPSVDDDLLKYLGAARNAKFVDLQADDWYMKAPDGAFPDTDVLYLDYTLGRRLMSGYDDGSNRFVPWGQMTRGMAITVIYRMAEHVTAEDADNVHVDVPFVDVRPGDWYAAAVAWGKREGITTGYTDNSGRFGPDDPISREQLATMIARYCESKGMDATSGDVSMFRDGDSVSSWARDGVAFCYAHEIVSGIGDTGNFAPADVALRCQMAKIIAVTARMLE